MMIIILAIFFLMFYKLFKSHMKIHKLNRFIKLIWNDRRARRDFWDKTICKKCNNTVDDYNDYEEYLMYEVCWKCKKRKSAFDTGIYPTCWDCYGYKRNGDDDYEYLEQYGYSIVEVDI